MNYMDTLNNIYKKRLEDTGEVTNIDGIDTIVFFKEIPDVKDGFDYKHMYCNKNLVQQGSVINSLGCKWLSISKAVNYNDTYDKVTIRKASQDIVFNCYGIFYPITNLLDVQILDTTTNQFMTLSNGRIQLTLPYSNFLHKHIDLTTRIYSMNQPFKVVGINISQEGLMILTLDKDGIATTDDVTNNIADAFKYGVSIVINDATNDIIKMQKGYEFDLNYYIQSVYNTSTWKLTDIECIYTSSDKNVFAIDNNGHIKTVNLGTANLTITIKNKPELTKVLSIQVIDIPAYSVNVTGSASISLNGTSTYTATTKINYVLDSSKTVSWSLTDTNGAATTLATISSSTGTTCTIKANNSSLKGYVRLRATSTTDNTTYGDIIILIKSVI